VAGALPRALARRGHDCAVLMPLYRAARLSGRPLEETPHTFEIPIGPRLVQGRLWRSTLPDSDVPIYLVEQPDYFDRDDPAQGRGLYQVTAWQASPRDYPDNCARFVFFCRAILEAIRLLDFWPDVLHLNDWQTGLVPVYLREDYARLRDPELRRRYQRLRTLFTIHNIAYQGNFWHWDILLAGLGWHLYNHHQLEFHGHLSFLKGGLVFADLLSTVSPTYAREIQTFLYGYGMQGVLMQRSNQLFGIVNGVDYSIWDSARDTLLPAQYSAEAVQPGKGACKAALQRHYGLPEEPDTPLLAMIARLVEQKGPDLLGAAAPRFLDQGAQLVVLGSGEQRYLRMLEDLRKRYPRQVGLTLGFDENLAHRIEAGADLFLMPSLYEPSGLNQLYSMKYGTPPIVRATGGLADTVVDTNPATLAAGTATGFSFTPYAADAFFEAVRRALDLYRSRPEPWNQVVRNAMLQDWSWDHSAAEYEKLYQRCAENPKSEIRNPK